MIYITYTGSLSQHADEVELVKSLCQFEGYNLQTIYPEDPRFKEYFKDNHPPAILVYEELDKDPTVFYGFWEFAKVLLKCKTAEKNTKSYNCIICGLSVSRENDVCGFCLDLLPQ